MFKRIMSWFFENKTAKIIYVCHYGRFLISSRNLNISKISKFDEAKVYDFDGYIGDAEVLSVDKDIIHLRMIDFLQRGYTVIFT